MLALLAVPAVCVLVLIVGVLAFRAGHWAGARRKRRP